MLSAGDEEAADLIGLISSFLPPPLTDADGASSVQSEHPGDAPILPPSGNDISTSDGNAYAAPVCRVIVLSKDRPFQLRELLRSMKLPNDDSESRTFLSCNYDIKIILRASTPAFADGYETVMHECDGMHFLIEDDFDDSKSFSSLLDTALANDNAGDKDATDSIIMFLTDDCLLLAPLEEVLACAAGALRGSSVETSNVFNFLSRLHPGISWCQTRGVASPPPRDELQYHSLARYLSAIYDGKKCADTALLNDGVYVYNRKRSSGEFAYTFDLSGGAYRQCDVIALLQRMSVEERRHPNILEMKANQVLKDACDNTEPNEHLGNPMKPLSSIPSRPLMVILAVNRVQDVFQAPVAMPVEDTSDMGLDPSDPESLLGLLDDDCHLDIDRYRTTLYNTSHIGDFFTERPSKNAQTMVILKETEHSESSPAISVLIPVHRGPPDAAMHSILSIMMQPIEERDSRVLDNALLSPMQIVLVDDRCTDGSIDKMVKACQNLADAHDDVQFTLQDHRLGEVRHEEGASAGDQSSISIHLDIVESPRPGVACALNHGLSHCRADLVARMDADDIAAPRRLYTQISFMRANPSFDVVGSSAVTFSERQGEGNHCLGPILPYDNLSPHNNSYRLLRPSLPLSEAGFMSWGMLFTCCIVHPSVIFRKNIVQELGGYDESISRCEDYDLWLRTLDHRSRSIICLPFLGLWHRKHSQSSSSVGSTVQKEEADTACCRAIGRILPPTTIELEHVSTLRNPSSAQSPESFDLATQLLHRLETSFIEKHSKHLTPQEVALIQLDCNARIGELATILATKFGHTANTSFAWNLWCQRCPDKQLERISLLCHTANVSATK